MEGFKLVHSDDDQPDDAESFYQGLVAAIADDAAQPLVLDLSLISFITTDMLMRLITAARLHHRLTGQPTILDGMQLSVYQYLERVDLFTTCGDCIRPAHHLEAADCWSRSRASDKLLEVMPIRPEATENSRDVITAVARARRILDRWFDANPATIGPITTILSEIASNVTHSHDQGFAVIQHHRRQPGGQVTIAVCDLGIGVEDSLRQHGARLRLACGESLPVGAKAILQALELGVTARGDVGGVGLHLVKTIVEQWQGTLVIRSKQSSVRIIAGKVQMIDGLVEIPGTQVVITVHR